LDALASNGDLQYYDFCRRKMEDFKHEEIHPEPLLKGKDLITLGFAPGPLFHDILEQLHEAQLEGEISTREQALDWVQRHHGKRG
jgi:poly(A) polymerase